MSGFTVLLLIWGKGQVGSSTGDIYTPASSDTNYKTWEAENSISMAWLINSMEPHVGRMYLFYKNAHEIWKAAEEMYSDFENTSNNWLFMLLIEIVSKVIVYCLKT